MATATQNVYPDLRYERAREAVAWLGEAFGFEPVLLVPGATPDSISHGELRRGDAYVMVSSPSPALSTLDGDGNAGAKQSLYVVVPDPDDLYARANAAGARVIIDLHDADYGSRGFTCLDPEGHVWSFGTYRPEA